MCNGVPVLPHLQRTQALWLKNTAQPAHAGRIINGSHAMIRAILGCLLLLSVGGALFLYFWDVPVEREMVEIELDPSLLRE